MKSISKSNFSGTTADLQARIAAFIQAKADHALTVGVPAPREEDFIEELARTGETFEVIEPPPPPTPLTPKELAAIDLQKKRAIALRVLDEQRLDLARADPNAPQEIKDYDAALKGTVL